MADLENPKFLAGTKYLYQYSDADALPIDEYDKLTDFVSLIGNDSNSKRDGLRNLYMGLEIISQAPGGPDSWSSDANDMILHNSEYYYKVYASLFTETFHDQLLTDSPFFKALHEKAARAKSVRRIHLNDVQNSAENATENWQTDANQLHMLYERLRANRNHEYINLIDDNSTLIRQGQLNHDMLLRRQFINKLLRDLLILICLLTLTGFLNTLGYDMTTIFTFNVIILTVFGLSFLYALYSRQRRHSLNYKRMNLYKYPIRNEDLQQKYTSGNCEDDPNQYTTGRCKGLQ
tara:strand:+ start:3722 stop:4594 length:873 start_codon:yes stop_codon:yes gene_type:complete